MAEDEGFDESDDFDPDSSDTVDSEDADFVKQHGTSWLDVAWLMLSDIVGTSVLTFAGVARQLGWVLTVVFIVGLFPLAVYVSSRMSQARTLMAKVATVQGNEEPQLGSMGAMASQIFRSPLAGPATYFFVYGYNLLGQASYLLVLGNALQQIFNHTDLCLYIAVLIGCAFLLPAVTLVRRLRESVGLCIGNLVLIVAVIVITLVYIARQGRSPCVTSPAFSPDLSLLTALGAATNIVYSYSGQWMYFEIMDTMQKPHEFPKAFGVAGPVMVTSYLAVALVSFYYGVDVGNIVDALPHSGLLSFVAVMLFVHVAIVYLIKSVVLQIYFHSLFSPGDLHERTLVSYLKHGSYGLAMLVFGFIVANSVPFFSQLLGLIGGLLGGPINFLFPLYLFLAALGRQMTLAPVEEDTEEAKENSAQGRRWEETSFKSCCRGLRSIPCWELALLGAIFVFFVMTTVLGVTEQIKEIIDLSGDFGAPFTCHALPPESSVTANCTSAEPLP